MKKLEEISQKTSGLYLSICMLYFAIIGCERVFVTCSGIESKIIDYCARIDTLSVSVLPVAELFSTEFDTMYVVHGPMLSGRVASIIGADYAGSIPDDARLFIATRNGKVVYDDLSYCGGMSYDAVIPGRSLIVAPNGSSLYIRSRRYEGRKYYSVDSVK